MKKKLFKRYSSITSATPVLKDFGIEVTKKGTMRKKKSKSKKKASNKK